MEKSTQNLCEYFRSFRYIYASNKESENYGICLKQCQMDSKMVCYVVVDIRSTCTKCPYYSQSNVSSN